MAPDCGDKCRGTALAPYLFAALPGWGEGLLGCQPHWRLASSWLCHVLSDLSRHPNPWPLPTPGRYSTRAGWMYLVSPLPHARDFCLSCSHPLFELLHTLPNFLLSPLWPFSDPFSPGRQSDPFKSSLFGLTPWMTLQDKIWNMAHSPSWPDYVHQPSLWAPPSAGSPPATCMRHTEMSSTQRASMERPEAPWSPRVHNGEHLSLVSLWVSYDIGRVSSPCSTSSYRAQDVTSVRWWLPGFRVVLCLLTVRVGAGRQVTCVAVGHLAQRSLPSDLLVLKSPWQEQT